MQLFETKKGKVSFLKIEANLIELSEYNPRKRRDSAHVKGIAESINANGFDEAYAIKVHEKEGKYFAFAGGTRLTACKELGLTHVPCFVHEGFTASEIWRLAYNDQEQGKTQRGFSIVDVWLDYKASGKTIMEIAQLLGVGKSIVGYRMQLANLPQCVLDSISTKDFLSEGVCRELLNFHNCGNSFITTDRILLEIIENVCARKTNPTAKDFEKEVAIYNSLISAFQDSVKLVQDKEAFTADLIAKNVRTPAQITSYLSLYLDKQAAEARKEKEHRIKAITEAEKKEKQAIAEQEKMKARKLVVDNIKLGSCLGFAKDVPQQGIKLMLTDPPYGMGFQSNRRTASEKLDKIENDDNILDAIRLFSDMLHAYKPAMCADSTALVFCTWKYENEFRKALIDAGYTIKGSLVWVKRNHGTGDLKGTFAPKHERIIHAVLGSPTLNQRYPDVIEGGVFLDTNIEHPTPKPIDLLKKLIEATTLVNDFVFDPFLGIGSTMAAALEMDRKVFACELQSEYYYEAISQADLIIKNK